MLVVDVIVILVVAVVLITTVISIGRPVAELVANKMRFKYDSLGSEAEQQLRTRVASLEEDLRQLRGQVGELKATTDFAVKLLESHGVDTQEQSAKIVLIDKEKEKKPRAK